MNSDIESHPEVAYRRGGQQIAYMVLQMMEQGIAINQIRRWIEIDLFKWRLAAVISAVQAEEVPRVPPPELGGTD